MGGCISNLNPNRSAESQSNVAGLSGAQFSPADASQFLPESPAKTVSLIDMHLSLGLQTKGGTMETNKERQTLRRPACADCLARIEGRADCVNCQERPYADAYYSRRSAVARAILEGKP